MEAGLARNPPVAEAAIYRLSRYLQSVVRLDSDGVPTVLSSEIGGLSGVSAEQVRKDFSHFGQFGRPGVGYSVPDLRRRLARILRLDQEQHVVIVGAGHLGAALVAYPEFAHRRFRIVAVIDSDRTKVGTTVGRHRVRDVDELPGISRLLHVDIGVIAVPAESAQDAANAIVEAKITAILNFASVRLRVPANVVVKTVDLNRELEWLAFFLPAFWPGHAIHDTSVSMLSSTTAPRSLSEARTG